ncbi:MAG TPA: regulatory protein RecX [Steroidobacteraceae bacterium]|nr:regulatory protein RecX [Steroidobacteraceae bacterium]
MPSGPGHGGGAGRARGRGFGRGRKRPEEPASAEEARGRAIGLLSRRDYPRRALKQRLADSGFADEAAESAVAALEDERLVDDARYVEAAVAGRTARGQGPIRIALELRRLGVGAALVAAAVDARSPEWAERACELRRRRFGAEPPREPKERARQVRFLLQRGFGGDHIRRALEARAGEDFELDEGGLDAGAGDLDPAGE